MKLPTALLSLSLTIIASVTISVVIPMLILSGGDLTISFTSETQRLIVKAAGIVGIIFGFYIGGFLWALIQKKKHNNQEIREFSDRWLTALALNKIITCALK